MRTRRAAFGGIPGQRTAVPLPSSFVWEHTQGRHTQPPSCNRAKYPTLAGGCRTPSRLTGV